MGQHSSPQSPAAGLISSHSPPHLQTAIKRKGDASKWQTWPCPNFLKCVAVIKLKMTLLFLKIVHLSLNI